MRNVVSFLGSYLVFASPESSSTSLSQLPSSFSTPSISPRSAWDELLDEVFLAGAAVYSYFVASTGVFVGGMIPAGGVHDMERERSGDGAEERKVRGAGSLVFLALTPRSCVSSC